MRTINYKVSYEKLISRLPAMFAFLEIDGNGESEIVKATRGKEGNYGKIVANINYYKGNFEWDCQDGTHLQISNGEHSYRTLIDTYYKAIRDKEWERGSDGLYKEPFLRFMERGIGLKYVGLSEEFNGKISCGIGQKDKFPLAPDYIYLGEAKNLYNRVIKLKKQLEFYEKHTKLCGDDMKNYRAIKDEFEAHDGEKLLKVLCELIKEAEGIALEYLGYAKDTNLTLDFNINLTNTIKDLGLVTPYIQEWVAGKRYYDGDVVYHTDDNGYGMTWKCNLNGKESKYKTDELGRKYTEGYFDVETELIYFEDGNKFSYSSVEFEMPKNWEAQYLNWIDKNQEKKYWDEKKEQTNGTLKIEGETNSHLTSLRRFETYMNKDESVETPTDFKDWLWYYRKGHIANREEKYDELGNLTVMRDINSDSYYNSIEPIANDLSNIKFIENTATNLAVWGDVLVNITANNNDDTSGVLTFEYVLGAHLIADKDIRQHSVDGEGNSISLDWYTTDDDGNIKYFFKDFRIDNISDYGKKCGVKYTESYIYYRGGNDEKTIYKLVEDNKFVDYVNGKYDKGFIPYKATSDYGKKKYKVGEIIYADVYNKLTEENKENCVLDKVKILTNLNLNKTYNKGDEIDSYTHEQLSVINKRKCEHLYMKVIGKINGYTYGQIIPYTEYLEKLTLEQRALCKEVSYRVTDSFNATTHFTKNDFADSYIVKVYENSTNIKLFSAYSYVASTNFSDFEYRKGDLINHTVYETLSDSDKEKFTDDDIKSDYYYLYDKMEFDTSNNVHEYDLKFGTNNIKTPYIKTQFETTVDIKHVDFEDTPLIRYDYYNGVNFQPKVNDDVNIERGLTQAFERHIKFGEIKTLEDMENFANGGFFTLSKEDIDLG